MPANAGPLDMVIAMLQNFGFFRVILPFLLIFSIIYAVLLKTGVLGDTKPAKSAAAVVAMVSAFLVIVYTPVVSAISTLLPQASFLILIVVFLLMVLGLFGVKSETFGKSNKFLLFIGAIIAVLFIAMIGVAVGQDIPVLYNFSQFLMGALPVTGEVPAETFAIIIGLIIIIGIVGGVIYMVTRTGE
jgi:hypothetical protein